MPPAHRNSREKSFTLYHIWITKIEPNWWFRSWNRWCNIESMLPKQTNSHMTWKNGRISEEKSKSKTSNRFNFTFNRILFFQGITSQFRRSPELPPSSYKSSYFFVYCFVCVIHSYEMRAQCNIIYIQNAYPLLSFHFENNRGEM